LIPVQRPAPLSALLKNVSLRSDKHLNKEPLMKSLVPIALTLLVASSVCPAADEPSDLAVVVNKSISLDTLTAGDVRMMFLGEKSKWPDGKAVVPAETAPESPGRTLQLKTVNKMSDAAVKRYYMLAVFNGKDIALPKAFASADALKRFVAQTPGAIGCIMASEVDNSVKVLKVDGAAPGDQAYKLR
jgi:hypothetical protein